MKKIISSTLLVVAVLFALPTFGFSNLSEPRDITHAGEKIDPDRPTDISIADGSSMGQPRSVLPGYKKVEARITNQGTLLTAKVNVAITYSIRIKDEFGSIISAKLVTPAQGQVNFSIGNLSDGKYTLEFVNTNGSVEYKGYFNL